MAAVFALVFLFVVASIALMVKALPAHLTLGAVLGVGCFVVLAAGVFVALFKLSRRWENEG